MNALPTVKNPRQLRALAALLSGKKSREAMDGIIGTTNSPEVISGLRKQGLVIPCVRVPAIDRDGKKTHYGLYGLTLEDALLAAAMLNEGGEA